MTYTAQCCCGTCKVTFKGAPALNALCHCDDCKRRTGSAFGWNVYFHQNQLMEDIGEIIFYSPEVDPEQTRSFCCNCGTTLTWTTPFRPEDIGVSGGAFIDPPLPQPLHSAADDQRCTWLARPEGTDTWP